MNTTENIKQIANIGITAKSLGITQENISKGTGISQSQISRVLSGSGKRKSKAYIAICNYVNSQKVGITPELVRQNNELIEALALVWDGSTRQSTLIANVIKSLGGLCLLNPPKSYK